MRSPDCISATYISSGGLRQFVEPKLSGWILSRNYLLMMSGELPLIQPRISRLLVLYTPLQPLCCPLTRDPSLRGNKTPTRKTQAFRLANKVSRHPVAGRLRSDHGGAPKTS